MKKHINYQTIYGHGKPIFAVVPYGDFLRICPAARSEEGIPHEVMRKVVKQNYSRIRAWREFLRLTQEEVAAKMGITQAAFSQLESSQAKLRKSTILKLAKAMGLTADQLY